MLFIIPQVQLSSGYVSLINPPPVYTGLCLSCLSLSLSFLQYTRVSVYHVTLSLSLSLNDAAPEQPSKFIHGCILFWFSLSLSVFALLSIRHYVFYFVIYKFQSSILYVQFDFPHMLAFPYVHVVRFCL